MKSTVAIVLMLIMSAGCATTGTSIGASTSNSTSTATNAGNVSDSANAGVSANNSAQSSSASANNSAQSSQYSDRQVLYSALGAVSFNAGASLLYAGSARNSAEFIAAGAVLMGSGLLVLIPIIIELFN